MRRYEMQVSDDSAEMVEAASGDYVKWEDVAPLVAEVEAVKAERAMLLDAMAEVVLFMEHTFSRPDSFQAYRRAYALVVAMGKKQLEADQKGRGDA